MKIRSVLSIVFLLAAALSATPFAAAKPDLPTQECMPVYREYDFGIVRYVSRDTCHAEVYVNDEQVWPPLAQQGAAPVDTCVVGEADCRGSLACVERNGLGRTCIPDPCYTTDCLGASSAADKCVVVIYIADYQWTYLCIDAGDASCLVYVKQVSGVNERTTCYGAPVATADSGTCIPVSGGMDYHSYVCADPKDAGCLVSTETSTDAGSETRCYGVLSPACLDMYWDADVGPVRVESRNSCHRQVYVFGQPVL